MFLVAFHRRPMKPQLLFVKFGGIAQIAKEQAVFDDDRATRPFLQARMVAEQLMRKYEQIHGSVDSISCGDNVIPQNIHCDNIMNW